LDKDPTCNYGTPPGYTTLKSPNVAIAHTCGDDKIDPCILIVWEKPRNYFNNSFYTTAMKVKSPTCLKSDLRLSSSVPVHLASSWDFDSQERISPSRSLISRTNSTLVPVQPIIPRLPISSSRKPAFFKKHGKKDSSAGESRGGNSIYPPSRQFKVFPRTRGHP
jgi:hypothetical protein